jgi:flagellar assembly protein FliH
MEETRGVQNFCYPSIPVQRFLPPGVRALGGSVEEHRGEEVPPQELAAALETAGQQAFQQGREQARAEAGQTLEQIRSEVTRTVAEFATRRTEYFRHVEGETVRLALAIARKVLHREAQMDPLLLAGIVRVALDQIQAGTRLVLRASPASTESWRAFCAANANPDLTIEVVPDDALESHRCVLQTEAGTAEISLDHQLQEIESGFFDLLGTATEGEP